MNLQESIATVVSAFQTQPEAEDDTIYSFLRTQGIEEALATKLIQFVPIAFCRFIMRPSGIRFAPNYVMMDARGRQVGEFALAEEPVFQEALTYCQTALAEGQKPAFFLLVAARSAGYRVIQELLANGSRPENIITSPPILQDGSRQPKWRWPFHR
jgi:hypothetical protein